ncbi:hypothetical protein EJ08DRAFT_700664 [Tothia fuscella]|uniref:Histone deacetylase complex subunit SAP30 Sin3 binding domain-containing protein n=1 Tax=Tothia fuscella TaxID=1048955 RepID=A0A9P4TVK3_9PEZI|nr:hypothetical protein EJ08DRAFT_700664 [Tothia fuscella]
MAPPKGARALAQEAAFEDSTTTTLAKQKLAAQSHFQARGRRNGNNTSNIAAAAVNGSGLKELAAASAVAQMNPQPSASTTGIDWSKEETKLLHTYRWSHRLTVPSAFHSPMANCMLQSGIGPTSPTMARARQKRRIRKEELALAVRKHFKEAPVVENEVLVELLYRIKVKDKSFRLKFPAKPASR